MKGGISRPLKQQEICTTSTVFEKVSSTYGQEHDKRIETQKMCIMHHPMSSS